MIYGLLTRSLADRAGERVALPGGPLGLQNFCAKRTPTRRGMFVPA